MTTAERGISRQALHDELDRVLDEWGIGKFLPGLYKTIRVEYILADGKPHIVVGERQTKKPIRM